MACHVKLLPSVSSFRHSTEVFHRMKVVSKLITDCFSFVVQYHIQLTCGRSPSMLIQIEVYFRAFNPGYIEEARACMPCRIYDGKTGLQYGFIYALEWEKSIYKNVVPLFFRICREICDVHVCSAEACNNPRFQNTSVIRKVVCVCQYRTFRISENLLDYKCCKCSRESNDNLFFLNMSL